MCGRIVKGKEPDLSFGPPSVKQINTWMRRMIESGAPALGGPLFPPEEALGSSGYNISPTQPVAFLREGPEGREALVGRWGLQPVWVKTEADAKELKASTFNARDDSLHKPMWRHAASHNRCVVPISGFYEWQELQPEPKRVTQPWFVYRADREVMLLAGLYARHDWGDSFTIVTTDANDFMQPIHNTKKRMPVILGPEDVEPWLDRETKDIEELRQLLTPCPNEWLAAHPVNKAVGNPRNDYPELVMPEAA